MKKPVASKRKRKRRQAVAAETSLGRAGGISFRGLRYAGLALFAAGLLWELWLTTQLCFRDPANSMELHTYASSHTEFHNTMNAILRQAHEEYDGYDTEIAFWGTQSWPLMWTLRKYERARNVRVPPGTRARYVILDNTIYEGTGTAPDHRPPPYLERYDWVKTRFRWYWQPMPLRWHAMRQFWLLWSDETRMTDDTRRLAKASREDWAKLFKAMIYRDEYIGATDPHRWDHLGGYNVYFGRLIEQPAAETGSSDQGGP